MRHILHGQATDFFEVFNYLKREVWDRRNPRPLHVVLDFERACSYFLATVDRP
jgi:hypothetical protein